MTTQPLARRPDGTSVGSMTDDELMAELSSALGLTAKHLLYLSAVWAELERRGKDLSALRTGIGRYLPLIATGQVLPELVVRYAGRDTLLRVASALAIPDQERLARGESLLVVVEQGGEYTKRMLPPHVLSPKQLRQVFADKSIRTEAEQIGVLLNAARPKAGLPPKRGKLRANPAAGVVMLGRRPLKPAELLAALADLRSPQREDVGDDAKSVPVKLTPAEHKRLAQHALDGGTTMQTVLRNALSTLGII